LIGKLYTYGYAVSVTKANGHKQCEAGDMPDFVVDAPHYPFNHSKRYWNESRTSHNYRLRESAPRDVLGTRFMDWNPLQPSWRKIIDVEEMPWVADHMVRCNRHNTSKTLLTVPGQW
jgi:hypothetical protein